MHPFKDSRDREWVVVIHVAAVKRVRGLLGLDLYGLVDDGFAGLTALLGDVVQLVDVLYVLCQDQAQRDGVSDEDFGRAMAGDALERAADAFLGELADFFPDPRVRAGLAKAFRLGKHVRGELLDQMTTLIDQIDVGSEVTRLIASSGGSPGPSASIPDP